LIAAAICVEYRVMERINKELHIDQILAKYPSLSKTFIEFGVPCLVCGEPFWGTVEELANQHGVNIAELVERLNHDIEEINENS
jgi:hybrid cluster-associated redox disulfide protein